MLISRTEVPPRGWNSYDSYMGAISEQEANANLDVFLEKLKPAGYEYFCIDAGWYADESQMRNDELKKVGQFRTMHIDEYGRYISSPVMFPHGLRAIADRCHENGVKFGVHMMRGMPKMAVEQNTRIKGTEFHARDIYDPDNFCAWCKYWVATNPAHPATYAYYRSEIEYLTGELTVDFIKLDDVVEHPDQVELFARALDSVERPVLLSLSPGTSMWTGVWNRYAACANMTRITADAWDHDSVNEVKLQRWFEFESLSGPEMWADLDMLPLGNLRMNITPEGNLDTVLAPTHQSFLTPKGKRVMMTIFALSCSPLFFGGDLPTTPKADFDLATHPEVLACSSNGVIGKRVFYSRHMDVRKAPCKNDSNHGWLGIFNTNYENRHVFLNSEELGFQTIPVMREIWDRYDVVPNPDGRLELYLPANGCAFLKY